MGRRATGGYTGQRCRWEWWGSLDWPAAPVASDGPQRQAAPALCTRASLGLLLPMTREHAHRRRNRHRHCGLQASRCGRAISSSPSGPLQPAGSCDDLLGRRRLMRDKRPGVEGFEGVERYKVTAAAAAAARHCFEEKQEKSKAGCIRGSLTSPTSFPYLVSFLFSLSVLPLSLCLASLSSLLSIFVTLVDLPLSAFVLPRSVCVRVCSPAASHCLLVLPSFQARFNIRVLWTRSSSGTNRFV